MLRSNTRLVLGSFAAIAVGIVGGWTLLAALPVKASAPEPVVEAASIPVTPVRPIAEAPAQPARAPAQTTNPNPAPPAPPARTAAAPPPASAAPAPDAAPTDSIRGKPRIHLDGERSELKYDGDQGGLHVTKDKISMRTPLGKFELNW